MILDKCDGMLTLTLEWQEVARLAQACGAAGAICLGYDPKGELPDLTHHAGAPEAGRHFETLSALLEMAAITLAYQTGEYMEGRDGPAVEWVRRQPALPWGVVQAAAD